MQCKGMFLTNPLNHLKGTVMDQRTDNLAKSREAKSVLRSLGAVEQYFWLSDQNSPKHFCMTLQVG